MNSEQTYERLIIEALRYFGMTDLEQIERMTMREYRLRSKAYDLRRLDAERDIHLQAWINQAAKAQKKAGKGTKPKWSKFEQFFNFKLYEDRILGKVYEPTTISQRLIEFRRRKENERL